MVTYRFRSRSKSLFTIRPLTFEDDDIKDFAALQEETDQLGENNHLRPGERDNSPDAVKARFQQALDAGLIWLVAADFQGKMVGYVRLFYEAPPKDNRTKHAPWVAVAVRKGNQRDGIATELVQQAIEWLREQDGFLSIEAEIFGHNDVSRRLFWSLGFERCGNRKSYLNIGPKDGSAPHLVDLIGFQGNLKTMKPRYRMMRWRYRFIKRWLG